MYSVDDLATFVAVAHRGGITAAAHQLGISPATASHRIAKLERALQLTLFHRNSRSFRLTDEGQRYLERIEPVLDELASARDEAGGTRAALRGHLRVTLSPWILSRYILPALPDFKRDHPELSLEFLAVDRFVPLVEEGQDCAVRVGQLKDSALRARRIADNERVLCAARASRPTSTHSTTTIGCACPGSRASHFEAPSAASARSARGATSWCRTRTC